jgi:tRNA-dihydrouridine synthase
LVWQKSTNPVVYNGDITVPADVERIAEMCAAAGHGLPAARKLESVMIGRGFLADPSLVRQCRGGNKINAEELNAFHDELYSRFQETLPGTKVVLSHMKELWFYMGNLFVDGDKYMKDIRRANNRFQYEAAVRVLLSMGRMK